VLGGGEHSKEVPGLIGLGVKAEERNINTYLRRLKRHMITKARLKIFEEEETWENKGRLAGKGFDA
jgi:hypothetical protein